MIGYREPGFLWKLDAPFVWGPVGGTADVPLRFAPILGVRQSFYHLARNTVNAYQLRHDWRVQAALARADGFVTAASDTRGAFLRIAGKDSVLICATAIDTGGIAAESVPRYAPGRPLNLVWSGLHYSRKALPLALGALALLPAKLSWHLDIIGKGPMTSSWRRLAEKLGVDERCRWHGWLPEHSDVINIISKADVFVFPSLQEGSPTVVMEALSKGVPVICLDHCGMADVVTEDCGIKIPVSTPERVMRDIAAAIERLAGDPDEVRRLSRGALERARQYSWENCAREMLKVYERAIRHWEEKNSYRKR